MVWAFWILLVAALFIWVFWMPTIVAVLNNHPNTLMIFLINMFFGWTLIGWLVAMIWARNPRPPAFLAPRQQIINNTIYVNNEHETPKA
jgi:hypothetical protein